MILFYILVSGMPLVNQPLFASFVSDLTLTKYVGALCAVYAMLHVVVREQIPAAFRGRLALCLFGFYLLALVSYETRSLPVLWELSPILTLSSFVLLFFVVEAVVDTPARLRTTFLVATGSILIGSLYMIREWQEYHLLYKDFRPGFVVGDANYFTLSALLCLPVAFYLMCSKPPLWQRIFLAGSIGFTLIAVMLGASRGGFLGLVAEGGFILWHGRHRARGIVLAAIVLLPLFVFAPSSPLHRLRDPNYSDVAATNERLVTWTAGLRMIRQHPLGGIGLGNFKPMVRSYEGDGPKVFTLAHDTYIEIAAELGIPGLVLFLGMLIGAYRLARRAARLEPEHWICRCGLGVQCGLIGGAVGIVFLSAETQKLLWLMMFLTPCVSALAEQLAPAAAEQEARAEVEPATGGPLQRPYAEMLR